MSSRLLSDHHSLPSDDDDEEDLDGAGGSKRPKKLATAENAVNRAGDILGLLSPPPVQAAIRRRQQEEEEGGERRPQHPGRTRAAESQPFFFFPPPSASADYPPRFVPSFSFPTFAAGQSGPAAFGPFHSHQGLFFPSCSPLSPLVAPPSDSSVTFLSLPPEIHAKILLLLDPTDVLSYARTCRACHKNADTQQLW